MARRTTHRHASRAATARAAAKPPDAARHTGRTRTRATADNDGALVIPLLGEELALTKRVLETGRVSVKRVTRVESQPIDEGLTRETVEITRHPVGREVERMPPIREEGDTVVIPVVEERLVIDRRLFLREEVRVRRVRTSTVHRANVRVRHHDIVITRRPVESPPDPPKSSG